MVIIYKFVLLVFSFFLIWASYMMIVNPNKVKNIISLAGSTLLINYLELITRVIIGFTFVMVETKYHDIYSFIGYFLILTGLIIMIIPRKLHHKFSTKASKKLSPVHLKIAAPFSLIASLLIIYGII